MNCMHYSNQDLVGVLMVVNSLLISMISWDFVSISVRVLVDSEVGCFRDLLSL